MKEKFTILAVGDISFSRDIKKYVKLKKKGDYRYPLSYVKNYLKNSDITIANLETTITERINNYPNSKINFKSDPRCIDGIIDSGINLLNLANNHMNDYNYSGLNDTIKNLKSKNLNFIGLKNKLYHIEKFNNFKIGFLGVSRKFVKILNSNINCLDNKDKIIQDIKNLKKQVDIIILSIHWGTEYKFIRSELQLNLSKELIKNGVDIILGHHPHVLQNMETINTISNGTQKTGYVFNSLGNFLFDSHVNRNGVRNSMILKIEICKNKKISFGYLPCIIHPELGFIPIPKTKTYQTIFPKKSTKEANDLFRYVKCVSNLSCLIEGFNNNKKNNINKLFLFIFFLISVFLIQCNY